MAKNKIADKKQDNNNKNKTDKDHKGDTGRTSNQGRKEASGGSKDTNNQGHRKDV